MPRVCESESPRYWSGAAALMIFAYVIVALWPFRWNPPRRIDNGARLTTSGTLRFDAPGVARTTEPPAWTRKTTTEELVISLRLRPTASHSTHVARILTNSAGYGEARNLSFAQDGEDLIVSLRTAETPHGASLFTVPEALPENVWRDIRLELDSSRLAVFVGGELAYQQALQADARSSWNPHFGLVFGNETTGDRPWLGQIEQAEARLGNVEFDYLQEGMLEIPDRFWSWSELQSVRQLFRSLSLLDPSDAVLNLIWFIPMGLVIAAWQSPSKHAALKTVFYCGLVSVTIESAQFFFEGRFPTLWDVLFNSLGAGVGACSLALVLRFRDEGLRRAFNT